MKFSPDGGYFPRIMFYDSEGSLFDEIVQRTDKYMYFHHSAESIVKAMKEALSENKKVDNQKNEL